MRSLIFLVGSVAIATAAHADAADLDRIDQYQRHAVTNAGDAARGRVIYNDAKVAKCVTCHVAEGAGGKVGPDLSRIGGKFDRIHLVESILQPSEQIVEGYRSSQVLTADGVILTGVVKQESDSWIVLVDAEVKETKVSRDEIEDIRVSKTSIMPEGLADDLSVDQFTDLVAYLETLRSSAPTKFGAGTKGPLRLTDGFEFETVTTGLTGAVALETLRDGRVLVCEQTGTLRVIKDGVLLKEPMLTLDVESNWERGLIGVTVDPQFPKEPWVYVTYVTDQPFSHHHVSRFRVIGDRADPSSEQILIKGDDQSKMGGNVPAGHQGGALHFGGDGKLYISIGEQTAGMPSQKLDTFLGKILRINRDGSIPKDNPFFDQLKGKYRAIWARGLRNPFTFAFDQPTGLMLVNDVGGKFEEINVGVAGANYGWPVSNHGPTKKSDHVGPLHWYPESSINGGDFAPPGSSPVLEGRYVFADFVHGWIKMLDPNKPRDVQDFAAGLRRPVDLRFAADGSLYVLLRNAWVMDKKFEGNTGSLIRIFPGE